MKVSLLSFYIFPTALKDSSKRSINSDWKIELPGEFELAGTTVRYVRRGLWEKMSAKGPTKTPLHLMVSTSVYLLYVIIVTYPGYNCRTETTWWWLTLARYTYHVYDGNILFTSRNWLIAFWVKPTFRWISNNFFSFVLSEPSWLEI